MSSTELEYVATTKVYFHAVWIRRILKDMGHTKMIPLLFYVIIAMPNSCRNIMYLIKKVNTLTLDIISFVS